MIDSVLTFTVCLQVDKTKNKQNLLDITHSLTEGVVGGQTASVLTKKNNNSLKKDRLIAKTNTVIKSIEDEPQYAALDSEKKSQVKCSRTINKVIDMKVEGESFKPNDTQDRCNEGRQEFIETDEVDEQMIKYEKKIESDLLEEQVIRPESISESDVLEGRVQLTEHQVLKFVEERKSWPKFQEVFMISALDGTGVDNFRDYLVAAARPGPWIFSSEVSAEEPQPWSNLMNAVK